MDLSTKDQPPLYIFRKRVLLAKCIERYISNFHRKSRSLTLPLYTQTLRAELLPAFLILSFRFKKDHRNGADAILGHGVWNSSPGIHNSKKTRELFPSEIKLEQW